MRISSTKILGEECELPREEIKFTAEFKLGSQVDDAFDFDDEDDDLKSVKSGQEEQKFQIRDYKRQMRSGNSKSLALVSSTLDYLHGDVTLTDRYGMIRGTFNQKNDGKTAHHQFVDGEQLNERNVNIVGSN